MKRPTPRTDAKQPRKRDVQEFTPAGEQTSTEAYLRAWAKRNPNKSHLAYKLGNRLVIS